MYQYGIDIINKKPKFEFDGDNLKKVSYKINCLFNLEELDIGQNLADPTVLSNIETHVSQAIVQRLYFITNKMKDLKADFLRISDTVNSLHHSKWEGSKDNWDDIISNLEFEFSVNSTITRSYNLIDTYKY